MEEYRERLEALRRRISDIMVHLDISGKEDEIARMEMESATPDFWARPDAQQVMRQMGRQKNLVNTWRDLERDVRDLYEMTDLALQEGDESLRQEIEQELGALRSRFEKLEARLLLSGEHDSRNAVLALHAGAGGTESQDWAEMLLRMYINWASRSGYEAEVLDTSPGEEAGIKSGFLAVKGDSAYGYLKGEHGVHRLVRLSPFDADHARHTSFALVEVLPEAEEVDVHISPDDLKVDTFRSSGPGGQHMQKTSSAVRVTHIPTGTVAVCESQRSQRQNREAALKILYARLLELEREKEERERASLKGERVEAGWGNQIRSYVLHPYRLVKDHRTGYETGNSDAVLEGDLDGFIEAYLRSRVGEST
ncbi:MAG: peptide chain release factor 2 [Chloroflexota bacterium]